MVHTLLVVHTVSSMLMSRVALQGCMQGIVYHMQRFCCHGRALRVVLCLARFLACWWPTAMRQRHASNTMLGRRKVGDVVRHTRPVAGFWVSIMLSRPSGHGRLLLDGIRQLNVH
jgi:hypothetical protein